MVHFIWCIQGLHYSRQSILKKFIFSTLTKGILSFLDLSGFFEVACIGIIICCLGVTIHFYKFLLLTLAFMFPELAFSVVTNLGMKKVHENMVKLFHFGE